MTADRSGAPRPPSRRGPVAGEAALAEAIPTDRPGRYLTMGSRSGWAAVALAAKNPGSEIVDWHDDAFLAARSTERLSGLSGESSARTVLAADPPDVDGGYDGIFMALSRAGETALAAEHIQQSIWRLAPRGLLHVGVDAPRDTFLGEKVRRVYGDATRKLTADGRALVLVARRPARLKARKEPYRSRFTIKDGDHIITVLSRPGVFSPGRLDDGAKSLIADVTVPRGATVLDLGCGLGTVGLAVAARGEAAKVVFVDSSARAIGVARESYELNDSETPAEFVLSADAALDLPHGSFDLVLANPPYYSDFRISTLFVEIAWQLLRPGGRLLLVSKLDVSHREIIGLTFGGSETRWQADYAILDAVRS